MRNRAEVYVEFFKQFQATADERCRNYGDPEGRPHGQAASLESLIVFVSEVNRARRGPKIVCDAGSGASTAVLCNEPNYQVITFDPDSAYAIHVFNAVQGMNLKVPVIGLPVFEDEGTYWDGCFYDYGTHERLTMMPAFLQRTRSVFYVDDCHDMKVYKTAQSLAKTHGWNFSECHTSFDEHLRFGVLLTK